MSTQSNLDRRSFIKISTAAGGGLLLGMNWLVSCAPDEAAQAVDPRNEATGFTEMNAYLQIATNGVVTIMATNPEIGQNIKTALPMIVAEELDIPWEKVIVEQAPLNTEAYPRQVAGGSYSVRSLWDPLREAGATARHLLVQAAAEQWQVDAGEVTTDGQGNVVHPGGEQTLHYGELVTAASQMEAPEEVTLKDPKDFRLLGKWIPNVDNDAIVTGKPIFGWDTRREGMLYAMVVRPPAFGQTLKSVDDSAARAVRGVKDVVTFDDKVAVLATSTWQAKKGRDALRITWEDPNELDDTDRHHEQLQELLAIRRNEPKRKDGNASAALDGAATVVEAVYEAPFLPHNPMAPMNFFAHVREDGAELYGPTQTPASAQRTAASILDMEPEQITVGMSRMGGGFGRRLRTDFVADAVHVSKLAGAPVNVFWTREDDMTAGIYRPMAKYHYRAGLDENGQLVAWHLRSAGVNTGNATLPDNFPAGSVPNFQVDYNELDSHVTTGAWRAPNHNFVAYAEESFVDEVAHAAGKDPVQFRLELLEAAKNSPTGKVDYDVDRYRAVVEKVADMAGWGQTKGEGVYQGIAAHFSYGSYVAQVAEVSVENGNIKVHKVYCAVDCGIVINRSGAEQQIEGGIVDGLGHAMFAEQTLQNGVPAHKNFDTYRLIRIGETPEIEIAFIENNLRPEGLGEPGLPPIGGAVANAVFAATGKRMRKQPFVQNTLLG